MGRVELVMALNKEEERELGESDFKLRKVQVCFAAGVGVMMSRVMASCSEMLRSVNERLWMVREGVEQTRSRLCPCMCVGEETCWVRLRQFIMS